MARFRGSNILGPYDFPNTEIIARLKANGLTQMLFNVPARDSAKDDRDIACHPSRIAEFRASVATAIDYAHALDCSMVNCLAGIQPPGFGWLRAWRGCY